MPRRALDLLDVFRHDGDSLHHELGRAFIRIDSVREIHRTPWGSDRQFVYCACFKLDA